MGRKKRQALEGKGWRFGTAAEFLGLSTHDAACVEGRLGSVARVERRTRKGRPTLSTRAAKE
jgi:hypothetical protein